MKALDAMAAAIGVAAVLAIGGCGASSVTVINTTTTTTVAPASQTTTPSGGGPCDGHPCIGDWQKDAAEGGAVVQCSDSTWSHAGGLSGACSHHGGETTTNGGGSGSTVQDLPVQCGYGLAGSPGMACTFAENAFYEYWQASGGDPSRAEPISVWSADAQQSYPLSCASGDGVVDCVGTASGGVSLDARFTEGSVSAYTNAEAAAYAASGKLGPVTSTSTSGFTPGDQNPNDSNATACESTMEVGPHSDCAVAQQVAGDLAQGMWSAPGSDTVSEGGDTITFNCSLIGHDQTQASQAGIYSCVSEHDSQDWFEFEFT